MDNDTRNDQGDQNGQNDYYSSYNQQQQNQYTGTGYNNGGSPKRRMSAGGIVAIILTVSLVVMLFGSAAVMGMMLFDPNSDISLYKNSEKYTSTIHEPETLTGNSTEGLKTPELPENGTLGDLTIGSGGTVMSTEEIYDFVAPSVVGITVSTPSGNGTGSGIIMTDDGYILTNDHVVSGANSVIVTLFNGEEYAAAVVGSDATTDVAVIKIDGHGLKEATFTDSDNIAIGEDAVAIGNPLGLELSFTITKGIVSALNRNIQIDNYTMTLIQTDAAINPGNSGGPLINKYGEVMGITSAKIMSSYSSSSVEGIGFAIPINTALAVAEDLVEHGVVTGRPYLGVTIKTMVNQVGTQFVYSVEVMEVYVDSPAEAAGFKVGDVIISFNGVDISTTNDLMTERDNCKPGDTVTVEVERDGKTITLQMTLGETGA